MKITVEHKAKFVRKVNNLQELEEDIASGNFDLDTYKVDQVVTVTPEELKALEDDMMQDNEFLSGKGGTGSTFDLDREVEHIWELTAEEMEQFDAGAYRICVIYTDGSSAYAIDSQGYNYARYIAKIR